MANRLRRFFRLLVLSSTSAALSGCLISNLSAISSGGTTVVQATATLMQPSPCAVNTTLQTTTCTPSVQVQLPTGGTQSFQFLIELLGYAAPITLYDPLIVQVPVSMSNFAGTITAGPPGAGPGTPLSIISGVTSVPIDTNTNLVAEPGMQLVIVDFQSPASTPTGTYTFKLQFSGTTNSIKALFATKVAEGANTYYQPIFPCVSDFANVSAISLPIPNLAGLIPIVLSAQGCNGKMYNLAGLAPVTININQHGLTGSWFQPATSGQGIEVEVFPNHVGPGTGLTQVSWFTYDNVAGGPERQRWYTLSGNVPNGQPASLTIYQNIGGNFNAPPITNATAVGTATISFDSCTSGELSYNFSDGSGRAGNIPLTRLTQNETCSIGGPTLINPDFALSGNWYDPTTSGQGFTVEVNPNSSTLFFAWYTYAPNGVNLGAAGQRWYTGQAGFTAGMRSIPVQLYQTTGGVFNAPSNPAPQTVQVGTGTLTFQSCTSATLNYTFTGGTNSGLSGTIALSRIGPTPAGCT